MAWIALIRHGTTDWNERGLIQGRTDIPLNESGVAKLKQTQLGSDFLEAKWVTSPLTRAKQTAAILNPQCEPDIHPELIETNWGEFEGSRRDELPQKIRELALSPDHGLDFTPPAGESPRMVRERITLWLEKMASLNSHSPIVAVTHKGVIRGALSAACAWDMKQDFRDNIDWSLPHIFRVNSAAAPEGQIELVRLNCPWDEPPHSDISA